METSSHRKQSIEGVTPRTFGRELKPPKKWGAIYDYSNSTLVIGFFDWIFRRLNVGLQEQGLKIMSEKSALENQVIGDHQECEESVIEKIRKRRDAGRAKYGKSMERIDLSQLQWLIHAQEEAMDLAIYLERVIKNEEILRLRTFGK
jgi:hypothetical protein